MTNSLKESATKGIVWNTLEKLIVQGGQFIIGIILARILMPEDFGLIGMLSVFIAISQVFIDSGMGSGLIQKQERSNVDFSTVFVFNFVVSTSFYIILFFTAPLIADFYQLPQLIIITRVLTLNIVINSLSIVQRSRITIKLDFKTIAKVNIISVIASGIAGIILAYLGYGVWALVIQNIVKSIMSTIMYWLLSAWKPSLQFSKKSFKKLFGFGSKLLIAALYSEIIKNIYNITIGKVYTAAELGYYTQAKRLSMVSSGTITSILSQVAFPILSSIQDDKTRIVSILSRLVRMAAFITFPIMILLAILADPLIRVVLTEKWLPAAPLLQWMCLGSMFSPIGVLNVSVLNATGRSDLFLKMDLAKIPLTIIVLIITIPIGVKAMVIGNVILALIAFFFNAYMPGKLFGYGPIAQLKEMTPIFLTTALTALTIIIINSYIDSSLLKIVSGITTAVIVYIGSNYLRKNNELKEIHSLIIMLINKNDRTKKG